MVKIIILAENYAGELPYADAGFSAYIEYNDTRLLFDTGVIGTRLVDNASLCSQKNSFSLYKMYVRFYHNLLYRNYVIWACFE